MRTLLPLALATLAACNPHVRRDADRAPVPLPEGYAEADAAPRVAAPERWWRAFDDPALDALLERAFADNLDLKQAFARVAQARALATQAGSARWPTLDLSASVGRSRGYDFFGEAQTTDQIGLSAAASYEVDLWGKIEARADAADADVFAARHDLEAIAMSLSAEVTDTWYGLAEQQAQRALLEQQLETNRTLLELVQLRFGNGLASAVDVLQQQDQVRRIEAQLPLVEARRQVLAHRLANLLGKAPGQVELAPPSTLPALPAAPATGLPADLLKRRPDVQAARARAVAADHRIAAALADRFPALRLSASTGFQADSFGDLIDRWVWSIAGSLVAPVIDGGRRAAVVEQQRAALEASLAALAQTLLRAIREVNDALVQEARQAEHLAALDAQIANARSLLEQSQARYVEGLTDYLPVLTALRAVEQTEQQRLTAQGQLVSYRIQLYRALGGDWPRALKEAP